MHICVDARLLYASGIGTYLSNLLPELKNFCTLTLLFSHRDLKRFPWLEGINYKIFSAPIYSIKEQIELPFIIPACDLFWSPHYNIPIMPIRAKKRVTTIHDVFHLAYLSSLTLKQKIYAKIMLKCASALPDQIITGSNFSKEEILQHFPSASKKITIIYHGVDKFFGNKSEQKEETRLRYSLPKDFFLFVGNTKPHKNLKRLIQAFGVFLSQTSADYGLVIAGKKEGFITGEALDEVLSFMPALKEKVHILGEVPQEDLPHLYKLARACVFPSLYEGFGLPALEAMQLEVPVIASNIAPFKEIYGNSVCYVDPLDINDIARGMKQIAGSTALQEELIASGKKQAEKYSWKQSFESHRLLFERMVQI